MATVRARLERLEKTVRPRTSDRDPSDLSTEELCFEILEATDYTLLLESPDCAPSREIANRLHLNRDRAPKDELAGNDPRLSDPIDCYISDLLRGLLGRFHDRVSDPALVIERYRGRFPDRILQSVYYAACHGPYCSEYSAQVRSRMQQLAESAHA